MEATPITQKKVGAFIAIGIFAVLASIMMLGGDKGYFKKQLEYFVKLENIQGLNEGSVVSLSGITIGNIKGISLDKSSNHILLTLGIDSEFESRLTEGTTVEIQTQGALGDKFLFLNPGPINAQKLAAGSTLEIGKPTDLMGIIADRGNEAEKFFEILSETHYLLKSINDGQKTEKILSNLNKTAENLSGLSLEGKHLLGELRENGNKNLNSSLKRLDSVLTKIDNGEGTLGALINDPSLHEQLKGMLGPNNRKKYMKSIIQSTIESSPESK